MRYFDVVFPLNLGAMTYSASPELTSVIRPGMAVKAELKRSETCGIVISKASEPAIKGIKEITCLMSDQPVFSEPMLGLLKWIAGYYIVPDGLALKSMLPKEIFKKGREANISKTRTHSSTYTVQDPSDGEVLSESDPQVIAAIRESIDKKEYRSYLFHAGTTRDEVSVVLESLSGISNAIILVPEISHIEILASSLTKLYGERLAVLHGKLTTARRRRAFNSIISGRSDIVLGTRPAVFAPLRKLSFISVLHEHDRSYKNIEGLRYNARDVAVMRGYLEKATVLLSSVAPSIESFYNTTTGKYALLRDEKPTERPRVEIIKMQTAKKTTPYLSKRVTDAAASCTKRDETSLFLINRKGYSIIQCRECSYIETCPVCNMSLVYHKDEKLLKCHCCGRTSMPSNVCNKCKGTRLGMVGAGTQRIASEIKNHLNTEPLRIDRDIIRKNPLLQKVSDIIRDEEVIVSTKIITKRLAQRGTFCICAFLNPDAGLHIPDFRSSELLFQELVNISEHIRGSGTLIIQTRMPDSHVYKCIRKYDYPSFFEEELLNRKSLMYPPFSRLVLITITSKVDIGKEVAVAMKTTGMAAGEAVEVIGPLRVEGRDKGIWKILLKSKTKVSLHLYVHNFLKALKGSKKFRITVDVDPVSI